MTTILFPIAYFIFFSVFLQTEAPTSSKWKAAYIKNFLETDQWKNINEVDFIFYYGCNYNLDEIERIDITPKNCLKRIRLSTIYLGCSYANVLKRIFILIDYFQEHCESFIHSENQNVKAIDCTIMLLNTISTILYPLVKLMKGALDFMDTLHVEPWIKGSKKNYTMNKMVSSLSDESFLNFLSPSVIHSSTIENKLITIKKFFYIRRKDLNVDMNFCHFKDPIDFISDIQILNKEYENLKTKENEKTRIQEFYHFLRIKIENEAQWTIKNRYIDLGFQYKINTYETFVPSLQEQKKPKTNIILSEDLFKTLPPHDNIEQEINKIPSEDLSESLLHDDIEEEMNKIPPKDLPESLLHGNIEEEEENLEDILLEIPNEFKPINMYL